MAALNLGQFLGAMCTVTCTLQPLAERSVEDEEDDVAAAPALAVEEAMLDVLREIGSILLFSFRMICLYLRSKVVLSSVRQVLGI